MSGASTGRPRVAVVGAGIAGLSSAWLLRQACEVTLFEADARAGGHADTQMLRIDGADIAVDMGFIVLNDRNYPNLTGLFETLGVRTRDTEMSFAASIGAGRFEYGGGTLRQLFGQKRNVARPRFWRMLRDVMRFYREAPLLLAASDDETLGAFLDRRGYGEGFVRDHILPMGAAIWSASVADMRAFPAASFARFFHNHGLLSLTGRPQWATVVGGSSVYVRRVLDDLERDATVRLGCAVRRVARGPTVGVTLEDGTEAVFDRVVLACHADQALALLAPPSPAEAEVLGAIRCGDNLAVLHSDARLMPRRRAVWSAWNYLSDGAGDHDAPVSLTYWMNALQHLQTRTELFVTLNPRRTVDPALVHATRRYRHPQFDAGAMRAQGALPSIQGADRVWFAGAWTGWGFHEDGIAASVRVADAMGVAIPWRGSAVSPALRAA